MNMSMSMKIESNGRFGKKHPFVDNVAFSIFSYVFVSFNLIVRSLCLLNRRLRDNNRNVITITSNMCQNV